MLSFELKQFLNEKVIDNLPPTFRKIGDKYHGRCPFCGDSRKSATKKRGWYYTSDSSYHCFNCGITMSGMKFIEAISGSRYDEIRREYLRKFVRGELSSMMDTGLSANVDQDAPLDIFNVKPILDPNWKNLLSEDAKEYLNSRKILDAPFLKDDLYSMYNDKGQEYVLIPWNIAGCEGAYYQLNDFKKHGDIKYIFPKNQRKLIYGLDNIDPTFPYIICFEGVFDSLFVKNGIATGTKSITRFQLNTIKKRWPHHKICISFDNDMSGIQAMTKLISANMDFSYFKWFNKSTKAKDINEYVLAKNNVNIFRDPEVVKRLIVSPMKMKLNLVEDGLWLPDRYKRKIKK